VEKKDTVVKGNKSKEIKKSGDEVRCDRNYFLLNLNGTFHLVFLGIKQKFRLIS
jgi:imidazole glycerol phosphate synthase subunit HisF